jgi:sugar fermentation stimulation protein A
VLNRPGLLVRFPAASFGRLPEGTPGSYLLLVRLAHPARLRAGRLPDRTYPAGWYLYAGSAMSGLKPRLNRYLAPYRKRHWHIDYLLEHGSARAAWVVTGRERLECRLAAALGETLALVPRFGASDCLCPGHLFYAPRQALVAAALRHLAGTLFYKM